MNTKNTLPITEARKKIFDIAEKVQIPGISYTLTEKGRPKAVIMSAEEYDSWLETMEVMRIFPDLDKDIKEVEAEIKKGDYITLDELLAKDGYVLADKGVKKYGISNKDSKKSNKGPGKSR